MDTLCREGKKKQNHKANARKTLGTFLVYDILVRLNSFTLSVYELSFIQWAKWLAAGLQITT